MLKRAHEAQDVFDMVVWAGAVVVYGAFIAAVSVETLSSLAGISVPVVAALGEVGASLYVSAVGLSLTLTVISALATALVDIPLPSLPRINVRRKPATRMADDAPPAPTLEDGKRDDTAGADGAARKTKRTAKNKQ
jgi:hypothetical protein